MISPPASRETLDQARGSCLGQRTGMPVWEPVAQPVLKQAIFCQLQRVKTGSWGLYRPCGLDHGSCRIICDPSARRSPGSLLNAPPPVLPWSHQPAAVQIDKWVITPRNCICVTQQHRCYRFTAHLRSWARPVTTSHSPGALASTLLVNPHGIRRAPCSDGF